MDEHHQDQKLVERGTVTKLHDNATSLAFLHEARNCEWQEWTMIASTFRSLREGKTDIRGSSMSISTKLFQYRCGSAHSPPIGDGHYGAFSGSLTVASAWLGNEEGKVFYTSRSPPILSNTSAPHLYTQQSLWHPPSTLLSPASTTSQQ